MRVSLTSVSKFTQAITPLSNAAGAVTGTAVNAAGFDRALFLIDVGTMANGGATLVMAVDQNNTSGTSGSQISGSLDTVAATSGASETYGIDVPVDPDYPWLTLKSTAGTGFVNVGASVILYNGSGLFPKTNQNTAKVV